MWTIQNAQSPVELAAARTLFRDYEAWVGVDLCFQGFENELATLPGRYAPPAGRLLLAWQGTQVAGCAALRSLDPATGEMKRLYVRESYRGSGLGQSLAEAVLQAARGIGYRRLVLDTLPQMSAAARLYVRLGFKPCEAYYRNPIDGVVYMAIDLGV